MARCRYNGGIVERGSDMPKTKAVTDEKKVTIRIPATLHQQLVTLAQDDARSLNAEILTLLREAMQARQK